MLKLQYERWSEIAVEHQFLAFVVVLLYVVLVAIMIVRAEVLKV